MGKEMKRVGKMRGVRSLFVVLSLFLVFTMACAKSNSGNEPAAPASETAMPESAAPAAPASETTAPNQPLYVVKYMATGLNPNIMRSDETKVGQIIKDKFNIVFEFVPYSGNWDEKVNLMLASGDYPEILKVNSNPIFLKYVDAGAAIPLDDFLPNAPIFTETYKNEMPYWRALVPDHKLYKWETGQSDLNTNIMGFDVGVRIDLLEKQGWPQLLSTDSYINFLKQAMKDAPETNGAKSIGMVVPFGEGWGIQGIAGIMYEKGGTYDGAAGNNAVLFNHETNQFEDYLTNEYVLESFKFFNQLYRAGILDPESFTDKVAQVTEKLNSGRALSVWYSTWLLPNVNKNLERAEQPELQYINLPIRSETQIERNKKRLILEEDVVEFNSMMITKNAKHPERLFELINWAASEEGHLLIQSGIEGVHYTVDESGKRSPTDAYMLDRNNKAESKEGINMFGFLGSDSRISKNGQPYNLALDIDFKDKINLTDKTREAYQKLGWKNSVEYYQNTTVGAKIGFIATTQLDPNSELGQLAQKIVELRVKNTAKLILSSNDAEFQKNWEDLLEQHRKLNPQSVVDAYNVRYQELMSTVQQ